jgi:hypothetical protein
LPRLVHPYKETTWPRCPIPPAALYT